MTPLDIMTPEEEDRLGIPRSSFVVWSPSLKEIEARRKATKPKRLTAAERRALILEDDEQRSCPGPGLDCLPFDEADEIEVEDDDDELESQ